MIMNMNKCELYVLSIQLVSDFRRRKVIEVFEKKDENIVGSLSFDFVRKVKLEFLILIFFHKLITRNFLFYIA